MDSRDHAQLPLDLTGASLLDGPFTPSLARAAGVSRWALERMVDEGRVRRLLRGAYVASTVAETAEVRARAAGLLLPAGAVLVDRTAAWVHGVDVPLPQPHLLPPLEALTPSTRGRQRRTLAARDVTVVGAVRVTTPLRTATDLGRTLAPATALGVVDAFLRCGLCSHRELLAELPRFGRHGGIVGLRHVVALADPRARDAAESALRFHWFAARLPTPVPGLVVAGAGLRLGLGLPTQRFGVVVGAPHRDAVGAAEALGWRVVEISRERVLHGDPVALLQHLEEEYLQQLLRDVS
ncbi:MAG TPA: type IV toxin-antitoxin system AbiEi family antitoxin domain-containing protein [Marmoricola sp.]|nr:type IV toxin-antitoxin system AbiEi family antitoxin domain-containing protein [Marmoricola sp.]